MVRRDDKGDRRWCQRQRRSLKPSSQEVITRLRQQVALMKEVAAHPLHFDALLTRVATEKRMSLIKAWEENEKAKADNK
ncbi:hypothetical protein GUJ93_ZPchr0010g9172 [Zizania palustris]|uniref:Uncharacterized protein n=1 Tax=Zizania palustris TaxID=103762 RepID=A0A8J5W774_ZIZPA|nr:hypothetical protein GUJ93_ZPchr0010g9172 [Zizania palustris]